uniref:Uncharacterized protein n=1 Tax=Rhipicephalus zambeziensis TaxID=60191 RepID=A0A224YHL2_9ACAR
MQCFNNGHTLALVPPVSSFYNFAAFAEVLLPLSRHTGSTKHHYKHLLLLSGMLVLFDSQYYSLSVKTIRLTVFSLSFFTLFVCACCNCSEIPSQAQQNFSFQ